LTDNDENVEIFDDASESELVDRPIGGVSVEIHEAVSIPLERIDLWEGNPNVMEPQLAQDLTDDIIEDGFDEPVGLVPVDEAKYVESGLGEYLSNGGRFQCWNGNHRINAMRELGSIEIPSVIRTGMTEEEKAIKVVRRNLVRGDLDPVRFAELIDTHLFGIDPEVLARSMGFLNTEELKDILDAAETGSDFLEGDEGEDPSDAEHAPGPGGGARGGDSIDGLASMISQIMSRYGDSDPQSYLCFVWKDKVHFLGMLDDRTKRSLEKFSETLSDSGQNFNDVLTEMLEERLSDSDL